MKKLILVTLLCCSLTGISYGQMSSNNGQDKPSNTKQDTKPEKPKDNPPTEKTHCTSSEGSWEIDVGPIKVGGKSGESDCETKKSGQDPK